MKNYQPILLTTLSTNHGMQGLGICVALLGVSLKYWIGRRRFYRRSVTGVQLFSSYEKMGLIRFMEWIGSVLGTLLILGGIFIFLLMLITSHPSHQHL